MRGLRTVGHRTLVAVFAAGVVLAAGWAGLACASGATPGTTTASQAVQLAPAGAGQPASPAAAAGIATTLTTSTETSVTISTTAAAATSSTSAPISTAGTALFDSSKVHTISVSFSQSDYDAMIATYKSNSTKDWIEASVTIEGVTFQRVGMRLKGNSSLRGLANGRDQGPGGALSAADPQGLPWLIRLDKNIDGQSYDGITDIVIRSNNSKTSLNEAVSLELLQKAGLASERAIAVKFAVNGGAAVLRLATEVPDDTWMAEHFSASGALYKAEAGGDYSFRGTDAKAYVDVFDQEAGEDHTDLTPLIKFLDLVNNSDDATFNSTLADRLDTDSLATYLAMEELIGNFDDIDGPGNNSYLYYDSATGRFTVVPWDHNLAFGALGGGNPGAGGNPGGGGNPQGRVPGPRGKSNLLVQRFHANADFEALYEKRLTELEKDLYESGAAMEILTRWVQVLKAQASDLVGASTVDSEATKISNYFQAR
jgi:spore coat protein CotH